MSCLILPSGLDKVADLTVLAFSDFISQYIARLSYYRHNNCINCTLVMAWPFILVVAKLFIIHLTIDGSGIEKMCLDYFPLYSSQNPFISSLH